MIDSTTWLVSGVVATVVAIVVVVVLQRRHRAVRRDLEERLRRASGPVVEEHATLDAVIEDLGDGIVIADAEGGLIVVNAAARRMVGDAPGVLDLDGWASSVSALHPDDRTAIDLGELLRSALRGERREEPTLVLAGAEGGGVHADASAWPLRGADGSALGAALVLRDVEARRRSDAEHEAVVAELTRRNREMERFTYTVSHELRSPLVTISGFLRLLRKDVEQGDEDRLRLDLDRIGEAVESMSALLEDLLELSRSGVVIDAAGTVDLNALVGEVVRGLDDRIERAGAEVVVAQTLPTVRGDGRRLLEVYQNLLENALKFLGDQARPRIEIGVRGVGVDRVFYVRDNGIGVPEADRERIFRIFERLDTTVEGTGVGLALVKGIVEAHHGRAWVEEGEGGVGATFCFTLPDGFSDG